MTIEIKMPALRPEMESAVLCEWKVKVGDQVKSGDILFEIETDKVVNQIEAAADMKIVELCAEEGDEVPVNTVVARAEVNEYTVE